MSRIHVCTACSFIERGIKSRRAIRHTCGKSPKEINSMIEKANEKMRVIIDEKLPIPGINMTIDALKKKAVKKAKKFEVFALYSISCTWWATNITTSEQFADSLKKNSIPRCPYCNSLLMEAPLLRFIENAEKQAEHYGGIEYFEKAFDMNIDTCRQEFRILQNDIFLKKIR